MFQGCIDKYVNYTFAVRMCLFLMSVVTSNHVLLHLDTTYTFECTNM